MKPARYKRSGASVRRAVLAAAAGALAALAAGCGGSPAEPEPCPERDAARLSAAARPVLLAGPGVPAALDSIPFPFDEAFADAGAEFGVPPSVLRAIAWVETRAQMVEGQEEFPGKPAAFGVMALRGDRLERGAALAGVTVEAARRDPAANVRAAAALVDAYASEAGIDRSRPDDWAPVVARFSGIEIRDGREAYVRQVERTLAAGTAQTVAAAPEHCPEPPPDSAGAPDYAPAIWRPSPNFDARPADDTGVPHLIILHTCEGNYTGCWSWLANPVSGVSAHYVVNEDGGEISQLVREPDRAWHITADYDCTLNREHECRLNGVQSNHFTIGIELAGFASQDSFPASQIDASAALVCDITRDRDIPRDWQHIVAHGQLQPENRTDPGPHWPWIDYLHRIQRHCSEIAVDDDSTFNDPAAATVEAPAEWIASDDTPSYYGGGYHWAPTREDAADVVVFSFLVDESGPRSLDARWTSGANRSPRAAYSVITAAGDTLATVLTDQTGGGGRWNELGTWTFPAGWSRVVLSRRDAQGFVVVADAVRARR